MLVAVCGTGTGVGKTFVTAALARHLRDAGSSVIALKPIETGGDADARALAEACGAAAETWLSLPEPISPHLAARRAGRTIALEPIAAWVAARTRDVTLVETAGGLFSPLGAGIHNASLVRALGADAVVLVAPDRLGVLHDVTATLAAASELPFMDVALSAPAEADASTGTNAGELAELGIASDVTSFARDDASAAAALWSRVVTDLAPVLGDLADGREVSPSAHARARAALRGQRWFVSVDTAQQDNVDTEELFFAHTPSAALDLRDEDTAFRHGVVPLRLLGDSDAWERTAARWEAQVWRAFVARVVRPIVASMRQRS
jgi:dethiobiotin synthetase